MFQTTQCPRGNKRTGAITVLTAFFMIVMLAVVAFAIDLGYLVTVETELQRTADSAALAACWDLIDDEAQTGAVDLSDEIYSARQTAAQFAAANIVAQLAPLVDLNYANSAEGDVVIGYLSDPSNPTVAMSYFDPNQYNAVTVRVQKTAQRNGQVSLFFAPLIFGTSGFGMTAEATAALVKNFSGFQAPSGGAGNLDILPFALDLDTWNNMLAGGGNDNYSWDEAAGSVSSGPDGIREVNLFPQGTGSPGNRGTIDIGSSNNSTCDIARQIVYGISAADLEYHGGELVLDEYGELELNGDTGISAGVKDELASIKGQPRVIPIFSQVTGPGNNAQYTIVQFAGVRIMYVKLTGSMTSKQVVIQPAQIVLLGGIPNTDSTSTSTYVYSPVWLVR